MLIRRIIELVGINNIPNPTSGIDGLIVFLFYSILFVVALIIALFGMVFIYWGIIQFTIYVLNALLGFLNIRVDVPKMLDVLFFPGKMLRHMTMVAVARLLGYDTDVNFYLSYGGERSVIKFSEDLKELRHSLYIGLSPFFNGALFLLLWDSKEIWINVFPENIQRQVIYLFAYLGFSIFYGGLPSLESVWFFTHSLISRSPWPILMTLWGLFATSIAATVFGVPVATTMFLLYEVVIFYYEIALSKLPVETSSWEDDYPALLPLDEEDF